jgi:hypothetical protein
MRSLSQLIRRLCWLPLIAFALQSAQVQAGMLGPEAAMPSPAASQAELDRAKVQQFLDRATVTEKLKAMGVDALNARSRVDSLTDDEVHALAQRIDAMPAGGALSQNDLILILLVALIVIVAL